MELTIKGDPKEIAALVVGLQERQRLGVYPFGIYIETVHGNAVFQVFTKLLEEWIAERSTPPEAETEAPHA